MLNFPDAPTLNQAFIAVGLTWIWDGQKWEAQSSISPTVPITFPFVGKPAAGELVNVPMTIPLAVAGALAGTTIFCTTLTTANAIFRVNKISGGTTTVLGAVTINSAGPTSCTLTGAGGTLAIGDTLQVAAPSVQDVTLADMGITIQTVRM